MTFDTAIGATIESGLLEEYFRHLVNRFYKILPMREKLEPTLPVYMESLRAELLGCKSLVSVVGDDPMYLTLLSVLQYLIDTPECTLTEVRREVFHEISICGKLRDRYAERTGE